MTTAMCIVPKRVRCEIIMGLYSRIPITETVPEPFGFCDIRKAVPIGIIFYQMYRDFAGFL